MSYLILKLLHLIIFDQPIKSDYVLRVRVHSYNNPSNRCAGCGETQGCCDRFNTTQCDDPPSLRCDNEFFFCVRPLGTAMPTTQSLLTSGGTRSSAEQRAADLQCLQPPAALRSDVNTDGEATEFIGPRFLGLPNPMEFHITASKWEVGG